MIVRIVLNNEDVKIFPLVTDFTLTESNLFIYRQYPESVNSKMERIDEVVKRSSIKRMEVVGF